VIRWNTQRTRGPLPVYHPFSRHGFLRFVFQNVHGNENFAKKEDVSKQRLCLAFYGFQRHLSHSSRTQLLACMHAGTQPHISTHIHISTRPSHFHPQQPPHPTTTHPTPISVNGFPYTCGNHQVPSEKVVKVPVEKIVHRVREVDVPYENVIEKIVHVPVEKVIEVCAEFQISWFALGDSEQPSMAHWESVEG